ncbi:MAG: hypothetical protein IJ829_02795, partial [Kiritimatiellae bacterium]|nr:hypothetical protein [Kiritimatiellia bacterium]
MTSPRWTPGRQEGPSARRGTFSWAVHSIRTRYSLATALFLLVALLIFYVGGRIVLVHLMREAEQQVREIGYDISRLAYHYADTVKRSNMDHVGPLCRAAAAGQGAGEILAAA